MGRQNVQKIDLEFHPGVINVTTIPMAAASYPKCHGMTSNYFLDQATGKEFMRCGLNTAEVP